MRSIEICPGVSVPIMGLGTWEVGDESDLRAILDSGFSAGYRYIDSAMSYGNEATIGRILPELLTKHGLKREDIFITSKLTTRAQGKGVAREGGLKSVENFGFDYLDLYLIHFPGVSKVPPSDPKNRQLRSESWLELEKLKAEGKLRAIGVSNYMVKHLQDMKSYATQLPSLNQCEFHPHQGQRSTREWCAANNVHFQAYSSLGTKHSKEKLFNEPVIKEMAEKYKCSVPQFLLAWAMSQDISVLPKSYNPKHVADNLKAADIVVQKEDVEKVLRLDRNVHYCWDPNPVF